MKHGPSLRVSGGQPAGEERVCGHRWPTHSCHACAHFAAGRRHTANRAMPSGAQPGEGMGKRRCVHARLHHLSCTLRPPRTPSGAQRLPRDRGPGAPSVPRRAPPPLPPHTGAAHALALLVQRACAKGWVRAAHVSLPASPHSQRLPVAPPPGCVALTRPAAASVEPFTDWNCSFRGPSGAFVRKKRPGPSVRGLKNSR